MAANKYKVGRLLYLVLLIISLGFDMSFKSFKGAKIVVVNIKANRLLGRRKRVELCVNQHLVSWSNEVSKRPNVNRLRQRTA